MRWWGAAGDSPERRRPLAGVVVVVLLLASALVALSAAVGIPARVADPTVEAVRPQSRELATPAPGSRASERPAEVPTPGPQRPLELLPGLTVDPASEAGPPADPAAAPPVVADLDLSATSITPSPGDAAGDKPNLYFGNDCMTRAPDREVVRCDRGAPDGRLTVAVTGDSKIAQWSDALVEVAEAEGWQLRFYLRSGCPFAAVPPEAQEDAWCSDWGRAVLERLTGPERPDVVITSSVRRWAPGEDGEEDEPGMADAHAEFWAELDAVGVPVVAIADTPQPGREAVYSCVAAHREDVGACAFARNPGSGTASLRQAAELVPGSAVVDLNDWVCPLEQCPPVINGFLVYRHGSHITNTYALALADVLRARLAPAVEAAVG